MLSLYRFRALECGGLLSSLPKFSRAFFSKLWRAVHKTFPVLFCDLAIEASFIGAKQTKLGCIITLCYLKEKTTINLFGMFFMVF